MHTSTEVGTYHPTLRPVCTCRCCRARRVRWQPRVVESTLITVGQQPLTAGKQRARHIVGILWVARMVRLSARSQWYLASAGLLVLMLLLLAGVGMLWDSGPLAPFLFRPTALVTIVPTRLDSQARLTITAVTGTPDPARHVVAARFVSATTPASEAFGQATGTAHVPATVAFGTLTFYNAATYPQTIAAGTVLTGADGVQVVTDTTAPLPAGNPPLFGAAWLPRQHCGPRY
jgi:hypothetical protein